MTEARQSDKCLSLDRHPVNRALSMQIAVTRTPGTVGTARILREEQRLQKKLRIYWYSRVFWSFGQHPQTNLFPHRFPRTQTLAKQLWKIPEESSKSKTVLINFPPLRCTEGDTRGLLFSLLKFASFFCRHLTVQGCIGISPSSSAKILAGVFFDKIDLGALVSCRKDPQNER